MLVSTIFLFNAANQAGQNAADFVDTSLQRNVSLRIEISKLDGEEQLCIDFVQ